MSIRKNGDGFILENIGYKCECGCSSFSLILDSLYCFACCRFVHELDEFERSNLHYNLNIFRKMGLIECENKKEKEVSKENAEEGVLNIFTHIDEILLFELVIGITEHFNCLVVLDWKELMIELDFKNFPIMISFESINKIYLEKNNKLELFESIIDIIKTEFIKKTNLFSAQAQ